MGAAMDGQGAMADLWLFRPVKAGHRPTLVEQRLAMVHEFHLCHPPDVPELSDLSH